MLRLVEDVYLQYFEEMAGPAWPETRVKAAL